MTDQKVAAVILAAGESKRFGSPKALAEFGVETALHHLVRIARESQCNPVVVVLGANAEQIRSASKDLECDFVVNHEFVKGQTSSLQVALQNLSSRSGLTGVAFFLVDHPLVRTETVRSLVGRFFENPKKVVRPMFKERGGHPTFFPLSLSEEIWALDPSASIRSVLLTDERRLDVPINDPGVCAEFDTLEEYRRLLEKMKVK